MNKVAIVTPVVLGGTILLTSLLGWLLLKERISPLQGFGLVFVAVGIVMIVIARITGK